MGLSRAKPIVTTYGLTRQGIETKLSPFDPMALLDEIQRLVPGYDVSRLNLMSGNDQHDEIPDIGEGPLPSHPELIVPSNDTLFTSGTHERYSTVLNTVMENDRASGRCRDSGGLNATQVQ